MIGRWRGLVPLLLTGLLSLGCEEAGPLDGDCNVRVGYEDGVYRFHSELNQAAPVGAALGEGDLLDCDEEAYDQAEVFVVKDVDPGVAVAVAGRKGHEIYVREGLSQSEWPEPLRRP